ncbi:MAG: arylesterase [Burkholderiaceae bacterium]|jgi:acyl-CoA thioesterase-1
MIRSQCRCRILVWLGIIAPLVWGIATTSAAQTVRPIAARTILVVGDSISAEYGLPRDTGWVKLLRDRLQEQHKDYSVVNASISGDTSAGGAERLPELLRKFSPNVVIIELGGNDGLRGLQLSTFEANLRSLIQMSQAAHAQVLLVGMQLPPNYGRDFTTRFADLYPALAKQYHTALVPFFFAGFADQLDLFQADRIHPTQAAQPRLLANVWPYLAPLVP